MKIVPAVLAETFDEFLLRLRQAESFTDYIQIDLMDGIFVPSKSILPEKINEVHTPLSFEVHIMAQDPFDVMNRINHKGLKKIIFHFEAKVDHSEMIKRIRDKGLTSGMAVNPETGIDKIKDIVKNVDTLLFLTVDPGRYGSPFRPEVLKKIQKSRNIFKNTVISADGGISLDNLKTLYNLGVDYVCVGSRIFLHGNPADNYRLFIERLREFERVSV
jgi:ribulose-phosphate 3-epimerase